MNTLIICLVIFTIFGILVGIADSDDAGGFLGGMVIGGIVGLIVGLILAYSIPSESKIVYQGTVLLDPLQAKSYVGINNDNDGYKRYVVTFTDTAAVSILQLYPSYAKIIYKDTIPHMKISEVVPVDCQLNNFSFDSDWGDKYYEIVIPKGSFKLDQPVNVKK